MSTSCDCRPRGRDDIISLARAAAELPMRDSDARRLLMQAGLVSIVAGRPMVVWGDVVALVQGSRAANEAPPGWVPKRAPERRGE